jgi:hypothetical protein
MARTVTAAAEFASKAIELRPASLRILATSATRERACHRRHTCRCLASFEGGRSRQACASPRTRADAVFKTRRNAQFSFKINISPKEHPIATDLQDLIGSI